jgi:hypothetical protein
LKRRVAKKLYKNQEELVKGISDGIKEFDIVYFHKIYQHLLWQMVYAYNKEDLE